MLVEDSVNPAKKVSSRRKFSQQRDNKINDLTLYVFATRHPLLEIREKAKSALLKAHLKLIQSEAHRAWKNDKEGKGASDIEDYIQEGIIVALESYRRYDPFYRTPSGQFTKLSSFICTSVRRKLCGVKEDLAVIRCTAQNQKFKTYFNGGYDNDPAKKLDFEQKNKLTTPEEIQKARVKYEPLWAGMDSLDTLHENNEDGYSLIESTADPHALTSDDILQRIVVETELSTWSELHRNLFYMKYLDQYSSSEIAKIIEKSEKDTNMELSKMEKLLKIFQERIKLEIASAGV